MMPHLMQALADERTRDRDRELAARPRPVGADAARPRRVSIRFGYWLISIGCRLVAPDLTAAVH